MKVALIGSAPSSVQLAPWNDPTWQIWGCSPGAWPHAKRVNRWVEIHKWEPEKPWFSAEYIKFMASISGPVFMIRPVPEVPNSIAYPKEEMVARFGPWFFGSTLSWMFAQAIAEGATEIGLWGVDMSATEEWIYQRSGCHYFIHLAKTMGIKVTTPVESDLLRPAPLYGFSEEDPMFGKMQARQAELSARLQDAIRREAQAHDERLFLQGAIDDMTYMQKTWIADRQAIDMVYSVPAWVNEAAIPVPDADPAPFIESTPDPKPNGLDHAPAKLVKKARGRAKGAKAHGATR